MTPEEFINLSPEDVSQRYDALKKTIEADTEITLEQKIDMLKFLEAQRELLLQ